MRILTIEFPYSESGCRKMLHYFLLYLLPHLRSLVIKKREIPPLLFDFGASGNQGVKRRICPQKNTHSA